MGDYGRLPLTGAGTLAIGTVAVTWPMVAVAAAVAIVAGLLILRMVRPARIETEGVSR